MGLTNPVNVCQSAKYTPKALRARPEYCIYYHIIILQSVSVLHVEFLNSVQAVSQTSNVSFVQEVSKAYHRMDKEWHRSSPSAAATSPSRDPIMERISRSREFWSSRSLSVPIASANPGFRSAYDPPYYGFVKRSTLADTSHRNAAADAHNASRTSVRLGIRRLACLVADDDDARIPSQKLMLRQACLRVNFVQLLLNTLLE